PVDHPYAVEHRQLYGGHSAGWPGYEKRYLAGRVHPAATRRGHGITPGSPVGGTHAFPPDLDDQPGGHSWFVPVGSGHRPRRADAATAGYHGHRRVDGEYVVHAHGDSGWLSGVGTAEAP